LSIFQLLTAPEKRKKPAVWRLKGASESRAVPEGIDGFAGDAFLRGASGVIEPLLQRETNGGEADHYLDFVITVLNQSGRQNKKGANKSFGNQARLCLSVRKIN